MSLDGMRMNSSFWGWEADYTIRTQKCKDSSSVELGKVPGTTTSNYNVLGHHNWPGKLWRCPRVSSA